MHPGHRSAACTLVLAALALLASALPRGVRADAAQPVRRVVVVGLDGADWQAIDPLIGAGRLPVFARLRAHGRTGTLRSTPPLVSPIIWTTIATGRRPEDHRILDFMVDLPGRGQAPVTSAERRVSALWNLFSDAGRRVAVVGWWATWPAEDVDGVVVSDRVAPQLVRDSTPLDSRTISPAGRTAEIARLVVRASALSREDLAGYVPLSETEYQAARTALRAPGGRLYRDPLAHLAAIVASTRSYCRVAEALAAPAQPDLLLVYLEAVDSLSHRFLQDSRRGTRAVARAYEDADGLLGRLAAEVAPDTWFLVVSDHGFYSRDAGVTVNPADLAGPATAWHRPYGIVAASDARTLRGESSQPARDAGIVTPLDVAPTVLQAAGLPASREMPGRAVAALLSDDAAARPIPRVATLERARHVEPLPPDTPDEGAHERLLALGYVGSRSSSLARLNLGEILFRKGDLAGAERELRQVVDEQPANVSALLWLAKAIAGQGRTKSALDVYSRALVLPGDEGDALVEAVALAAGARLDDEARRLLRSAGARQLDTAAGDVARAIVARLEGKDGIAERELWRAIARDAAYQPALERLLELLAGQGRAREAVPLLRQAAERLPLSPELQALLGSALLASGDAAGAERRFELASGLAPDGVSVRVELARAQLRQGKTVAALASLDALPPSDEVRTLRGAVHASRGEWAQASQEYQAALEHATATPALLNALAWARLKLGERGEAVRLLTRSLALQPAQPDIRQLLSDVQRSGS